MVILFEHELHSKVITAQWPSVIISTSLRELLSSRYMYFTSSMCYSNEMVLSQQPSSYLTSYRIGTWQEAKSSDFPPNHPLVVNSVIKSSFKSRSEDSAVHIQRIPWLSGVIKLDNLI